MNKTDYDFSGWATKSNIKCSDGRTIMNNAFKDNDGQKVPLVWNHQHDDPNEVLGHALLENRADGVYAYCKFNDTESGRTAKELVRNGDVDKLSIFANKLKTVANNVIHGCIREVSLVLAGANPGAYIDSVVMHGEGSEMEEEGVIYTNEKIDILQHSDEESDSSKKEDSKEMEEEKKEQEEKDNKEKKDEKTVKEVFDTLNEEQKEAVYAIVGQAIEDSKKANDDNLCDVLIVGRGGGSIEDLWAFNEKIVAQAIYDSNIPIVSAVGHEIDFTIADFVSDKRAATPTAAAEIVTPDINTLKQNVNYYVDAMTKRINYIFNELKMRLVNIDKRIDNNNPLNTLKHKNEILKAYVSALNNNIYRILSDKKHNYSMLKQHLDSLNPLAIMEKGYSINSINGEIITDVKRVKKGDILKTQMKNGFLVSQVIEVNENGR